MAKKPVTKRKYTGLVDFQVSRTANGFKILHQDTKYNRIMTVHETTDSLMKQINTSIKRLVYPR